MSGHYNEGRQGSGYGSQNYDNQRGGHGARGNSQGNRRQQEQYPRGNSYRHNEDYDPSAPPGSAQNPNAPIAIADLAFNTQKFAARPEKMIQDARIGQKVSLLTNHAIVTLPTTNIILYTYDIEVYSNKKKLIKREDASKVFWDILRYQPNRFPKTQDFIFNDVNLLWSTVCFPNAEGEIRKDGKCYLRYKFVEPKNFGNNVDLNDKTVSSFLATLTDAIATARVRNPANSKKYTVFKRLTYLVADNISDPALDGIGLFIPFQYGTQAHIGLSIAIKTNLRAGITACFDLNHSLFTRPEYPLVRLLVELTETAAIADEEFEEKFDEYVRRAVPGEQNLQTMTKVLNKMPLKYIPHENWSAPSGMKLQAKQFKFHQLGAPADRAYFSETIDGGVQKKTTVAEYYLKAYGYKLRYPNLPVLIKKPSKQRQGSPVMYPMELVSYSPDPSRYQGLMEENMASDLVKFTNYTTSQRRLLLDHFIQQKEIAKVEPMVNNADPYMTKYGVRFGKDMLSCPATVLPAPKVEYGNSTFHDTNNVGEWKAVNEEPMRTVLEEGLFQRKGDKLKKRVICAIIKIDTPNQTQPMSYDPANINRILLALERAGQPVAWHQPGDAAIMAIIDYTQKPENFLETANHLLDAFNYLLQQVEQLSHLKKEGEVLVPLVFLIFRARCSLNTYIANDYNLCKWIGDNQTGVYSQGILLRTLGGIQENPTICPYTHHLVEKILGKIGTTHSKLQRSTEKGAHKAWATLTDPESPTLVLGIDVSHPKTNDRNSGTVNSYSIASVVGNIDVGMTQFRSSSRVQDPDAEMIVRMEDVVLDRMNEFIEQTGKRPAHVVVYRDGIGEGDFQRILYEERTSLERSFRQVEPDYFPTITYIVVSKRHHTKFFPLDGEEENSDNVKSGTLVEDIITTNQYYDFYLMSQPGSTGTPRPIHYYVLYDTWAPLISFWPAVTHAFTYNFARTTSTIAIPGPVMYAHLSAKRAKETMSSSSYVDKLTGSLMEFGSVEHIKHLNDRISVNKKMDGMTFV